MMSKFNCFNSHISLTGIQRRADPFDRKSVMQIIDDQGGPSTGFTENLGASAVNDFVGPFPGTTGKARLKGRSRVSG